MHVYQNKSWDDGKVSTHVFPYTVVDDDDPRASLIKQGWDYDWDSNGNVFIKDTKRDSDAITIHKKADIVGQVRDDLLWILAKRAGLVV